MAKYLTLANGSMLVGVDGVGQVRDIYYPYVGLQNHVSGASGSFVHRVGVWVDGRLAWLDDSSFRVSVSTQKDTMGGQTEAVNLSLGITLSILDVVDHEKNIFMRHVTVVNTRADARTVKLFFAQQFRIKEDKNGSTGFYDPRVHAIVHYKGRVTFLVNAEWGGVGFDDYSVGLFNVESHEGTHVDAEDGFLSKNAIEHGSVDSVIGCTLALAGGARTDVSYWVAVGETVHEVHALNAFIEKKGCRALMRETDSYWKAWLRKTERTDLHTLGGELARLYEESLYVIRAHADRHGGIIASSDTDILNYGRDTYSYVWPRDAAMAASALDAAGYPENARNALAFLGSLLEPQGYLMHKYRSDGALGSSWHPWMYHGKPELPIQEDETATVLFMVWKNYERTGDASFIRTHYAHMLAPMAEFMVKRLDLATKLPLESYDLWEETFGTSTYTSASVFGALTAAARCAKLMGKPVQEKKFRAAAEALRAAIGTLLYNEEMGIFRKYIRRTDEGLEHNDTVDLSSLHGILLYDVYDATDPRVARMFEAVEERLRVRTSIGGYMRYEGDRYFRISEHDTPNPWIPTTLWIARYYIKRAISRAELAPALALLEWTRARALGTYLLPEQIHPYTGAPLSATPLVWSHAEYVLTVNEYLDAVARLSNP